MRRISTSLLSNGRDLFIRLMSEDDCNDKYSSYEYESDGYEEYDEDDDYADMTTQKVKLEYTHPVSKTTQRGICTHRMMYEPQSVEDVEKALEERVTKLDNVLQIGLDDSRILLIHYKWNDDKLLEEYTSGKTEAFAQSTGIGDRQRNTDLVEHVGSDFLCGICYSDGPLVAFRMPCGHRFCTDCYIRYVQEQNLQGQTLICCPEPSCQRIMRSSELQQLSDYDQKQCDEQKQHELEPKQERLPLTEEQIREMYQSDVMIRSDFSCELSGDEDDNEEELPPPDVPDLGSEIIRGESLEDKLFTFSERLLQQEREEREQKRSSTLASKYKFNIAMQYCLSNGKNFKNCPFPDCDSLIMSLGFDSNEVVNLSEMVKMKLIPTVRCLHNHQFCYNCMRENHSPCPCVVLERWSKKCKDDSETLNWINAHTKDCPQCKSAIEKNGGCNHMQCRKCGYQFCWVCMGSWAKHSSYYNCNLYKEDESDADDTARSHDSLKKYLFYYTLFNNQELSLKEDRKLLESFEVMVRHLQKKTELTWIETMFYREAVENLLDARRELMWSYAVMFYVSPKSSRQLMENAQFLLSIQVEKLSRLFACTPLSMVLECKKEFLTYSGVVKKAKEALSETYIEELVSGRVILDGSSK